MRTRLSSHLVPFAFVLTSTAAVVAALACCHDAVAQSGSRIYQPAPSYAPRTAVPPQYGTGSGSRVVVPGRSDSATRAGAPVAMDGYCSVCLREMKEWVKGSPAHAAAYDGRVYYFPGAKQKQMFLAAPEKYVPALGGDCTICFAKMGQRVPGDVRHGVDYRGRFYFFPDAKQKTVFKANPSAFADVDLALGGKCAVCLVEMQQDIDGKPEFSTIHGGMRYLFPSQKQLDMFNANPAKYRVKPATGGPSAQRGPAAASGRLVSARGESGCAACETGVDRRAVG